MVRLQDIQDHKIENLQLFYCKNYNNDDNNNFRILDTYLNDISKNYYNKIIDWDCVSKNIFYKSNTQFIIDKIIVVFYDSFLLQSLPLYKNIFKEIYFVKSNFNLFIINKINPDFIYEFRIERFL